MLLGCGREAATARAAGPPGAPFRPNYAWMFRVGNQGLRWALVCGGASAAFAGARGHLALVRGVDGPENSVGAATITGAALGLFLPAPGIPAKLRASVLAAAGGALLCLPLAGIQALQAAEEREVASARPTATAATAAADTAAAPPSAAAPPRDLLSAVIRDLEADLSRAPAPPTAAVEAPWWAPWRRRQVSAPAP